MGQIPWFKIASVIGALIVICIGLIAIIYVADAFNSLENPQFKKDASKTTQYMFKISFVIAMIIIAAIVLLGFYSIGRTVGILLHDSFDKFDFFILRVIYDDEYANTIVYGDLPDGKKE